MKSYRRLSRADAEHLTGHLLRLDDDSRHARFNAATSDATIRKHVAAIDWERVLFIGYFDQGVLRAVAEMRFNDAFLPQEAELAFSVERPYQNGRLGTNLMSRTLVALRNRGVRTAHIICLLANGRMQKLALRHRADVRAHSGEVFMTIRIPYGDIGSVISEITDEYIGWINTGLDLALGLPAPVPAAGPGKPAPRRAHGGT